MADRGSAGTHWAQMAERGTLTGLKLLFAVYRVAGRWLFRPAVMLVVAYFALTAGQARRASREYLDRLWAHGDGHGALTRRPTALTSLRHFYWFAEAILDKLAAWRGDISIDQIEHVNADLFESWRQSGNGGVFITSHLGNIEVCRAIGQRERDLKLTVLMHTRHAANFNRVLQEVAPDSQVELLEVSEFGMATAMRLQERVSHGHFIIIVGDRIPVSSTGRVVECEFLGRTARFPAGPFLMASLLDCPAGTLFCVRDGGRFRLFFDEFPALRDVPRGERAAIIDAAVRVYAARLEDLCLCYPLQWFNFFPFWSSGR
jgi:predicted LPLAT superfamily acyltransferase